MSHRYKAKRRLRYYQRKQWQRMIRAGEALLAYEPSKVKETPEQTKMRRAFVNNIMFGIPIPEEEPAPTTDECCECGKEFVIEDGCDCQVVQGYDVDDAAKDDYIDKHS